MLFGDSRVATITLDKQAGTFPKTTLNLISPRMLKVTATFYVSKANAAWQLTPGNQGNTFAVNGTFITHYQAAGTIADLNIYTFEFNLEAGPNTISSIFNVASTFYWSYMSFCVSYE